MPKPITVEMLTEMTPDQRKTLLKNAMARDTPAARDVIELLSQDGMIDKPKPKAAPKTASTRTTTTARKPRAAAAPKKTARKPVAAQFGRQA